MSQSATLYRISEDIFKELQRSEHRQGYNIPTLANSSSTFQGSFLGLEFILAKGQNVNITELISEIFNPKQSLGEQEFENLTAEEQIEFYESGNCIPFMDIDKISKVNEFLATINESDIEEKYDPKELNDNGIYPYVWHSDNSPGQAFNQRSILEDFAELKRIFDQADKAKDYILVFVG